ncbi:MULTISPECIES: acetyl-CoA carboxylase carboxyl transferase subunit alpha/beta [unclassified Desulfovibrio]|uniref:acetyl-CoA carboxylase carboxyl transferase subunit alpha/beta n=1 Tax=unclassified Desulfovibrio TaxID=2593640 RepID=UPI000F5FA6F6|nr:MULTISPECIES: acetyl-CoA carboxylase carboxyl transferase subunit alpha/beta [unclassified Desulfovibrio]RRD69275.1 acetyl-CoA carboxylase carboxyl transferase subunit alpha/beta [Desulfovibrio sp. OH1209_COT-279]RRD85735.1 acetyl-CoA carboxylase carboxyl transferase subunit alpha/beta [Desulfovibrio sp. OH1186_COT-070]
MDNNIEKRIQNLHDRLSYLVDIFAGKHKDNADLLGEKLAAFTERARAGALEDPYADLATVEDLFGYVERRLEASITPMDRVRIVRHPQRICLRDILENVYDNFTEVGGQDEHSLDPSMLIARAVITRRRGKKVYTQSVMVIGQEKGHGAEFRNGGSVKPWGNAKAQQYMRVAETEGIPIHTYIFTPGSYPIEDNPGAAQQIARNIYSMAGLRVPIIAVISEGGSGGAEAIGLADKRLMFSHGYYSVISPEGAAAIEGRLKAGQRATPELIESCARNLRITAQDNLRFGYVDRVVQEPPLGARPWHFDFFRSLRQEVLRATDEVVISTRRMPVLKGLALARVRNPDADLEEMHTRWGLSSQAKDRLRERRQQKFLRLSRQAAHDRRPLLTKLAAASWDWVSKPWVSFKYDFYRKHQRHIRTFMEEVDNELEVLKNRLLMPWRKLTNRLPNARADTRARELTALSTWSDDGRRSRWNYLSPRYKIDRTLTCPNAAAYGCLDLWGPDLFAEFAGVCSHCGYHFPMEPEWYVKNVFDAGSVFEFNSEIEAGNPLEFPGFDERIADAQQKNGAKSGCMTFEARIDNIKMVVAMLMGTFRGGSVGAAEGCKFVEAAQRAAKKRYPFLAYVHGTAGIRIQEGTHGVIQMPRCTVAVRRYIEAGGLYMVLYDTNSFAGPLASFLGCSPYQFAVRSSNIGFAGPGVIKETTGMDVPPKYHRSYRALSRGHIQGIWDRRQVRANLKQALLTIGGRNLYYR